MKNFNVIVYDFNNKNFKPYDIMPYLRRSYYDEDEKPSTFEEFKNFILHKSMYQWGSRCEYEIILSDWPCQKKFEKWDVHEQVKMNIDTITELLINDVCPN